MHMNICTYVYYQCKVKLWTETLQLNIVAPPQLMHHEILEIPKTHRINTRHMDKHLPPICSCF